MLFSSVQFSSVAQSCLTLCDHMNRSTPGLPVHHQHLEFTQTHVHQVGDAIQSSHSLLSLLLQPTILPSIRAFSSESTLRMRWPKYWSFSFSIIPSKEIPELISFRMDWLDLKKKKKKIYIICFIHFFIVFLSPLTFPSVHKHFSSSVVSDSLRPHESQHARPPCPSPTPGVHPNSCPSSQ